MGNLCCQERPKSDERALKKIPISLKDQDKKLRQNSPQQEFLTQLENSSQIIQRSECPLIKSIDIVGELGKGGQAEVYEVVIGKGHSEMEEKTEHIDDETYALKLIEKGNEASRVSSTSFGSQMMIKNESPFLIDGLLCCQNKDYVFLLMKIAEGGDLSSFMERTMGKGDSFKRIGEEGIRLVVAGIILGIQYLHSNGFIYCDLKMENILIGKDGYPLLTDFDLSVKQPSISSDCYQSTITTLAPDIFTEEYVDRAMDLWALGVLLYHLVYGEPPYLKEDIQDENYASQCLSRENKYGMKCKKASPQIISLINDLLKVNARDRIGYESIEEIKRHQFFDCFDWAKYESKEMENPLKGIIAKYGSKSKKKDKNMRYQKVCSLKENIQQPMQINMLKTREQQPARSRSFQN